MATDEIDPTPKPVLVAWVVSGEMVFTKFDTEEAADAGVASHLASPSATCTCVAALSLLGPHGDRLSRQVRRAWERKQLEAMRIHPVVCVEAKRRALQQRTAPR